MKEIDRFHFIVGNENKPISLLWTIEVEGKIITLQGKSKKRVIEIILLDEEESLVRTICLDSQGAIDPHIETYRWRYWIKQNPIRISVYPNKHRVNEVSHSIEEPIIWLKPPGSEQAGLVNLILCHDSEIEEILEQLEFDAEIVKKIRVEDGRFAYILYSIVESSIEATEIALKQRDEELHSEPLGFSEFEGIGCYADLSW